MHDCVGKLRMTYCDTLMLFVYLHTVSLLAENTRPIFPEKLEVTRMHINVT